MNMKKIFMAAAAILALAACNKNIPVEGPSMELTATMETGTTKSHLDALDVLWDANDEISVFSMEEGIYWNSKFATAEEGSTALFKGPGVTVDENLYALYPYDAEASFSPASGMAISADYTEQKVSSGSFSKGINLAVGKCNGEKNVGFRNVGALLSFTLTQERADTLRRIEIKSNDGQPLVFSGAAGIAWNGGDPTIDIADGATKSDVIRLLPAGESFNTGDTYYVWILPGAYKGITVTLVSPTQMTATRIGESTLSIARNQIVNLGEIGGLTFKARETEKNTLHFDFSGEPQEGWPTADKWKDSAGETTCIYTLDGVNYEFFLTDVKDATLARVAWTAAKGGLIWWAASRYVGLPALDGYRLIKVSGQMCLGTNAKREAGISKYVAETGTLPADAYVTGGEPMKWSNNGEVYTFNLEGTEAGTVYYMVCTNTSVGVSYLDLTYEKAE